MFQTLASCPPEIRLSTFFDPSQPRASFGDSEIEDIKLLLSRCPHHPYASAAPRTYIVLRYIDQLQILRRLLEEGFGDSWFPIGKRSLPSFLGPRIKAAIVEHQHIIFTKSLDLETGTHCYLDSTEELPYNFVSYIANGSFGQVSRIESKVTYKPYALKTIRRHARYGTDARHAMERFLSEMKIMKRLTHRHIVQYVGSFTDNQDLGIVMNPIADCDLAAYLCNVCTRPEYYPTLRTFYGCLATALAYLHDHRIKHRDIKPHNILVYRASVLLTDFGLSHETLDTSSGPKSGTTRYQSPEMAASDKRNESTDVWSLGCVFLEIMAALCTCNVDWLKSYYEQNGTRSTHFHANLKATRTLLSLWSTTILSDYAKPLKWIKDMLVFDRSTRPTAEHIAGQITAPGDGSRFTYSCRRCCDDGSDPDSMPNRIENFRSSSSPRTNQITRLQANASLRVSTFGQPLSQINECAEYSIEHVGFPCGGTLYTYSRPVPTILGKCIEHILSTEGQQFQGCLIQQPHAGSDHKQRCVQLKEEFDTVPEYGKHIDWGRYTLFECASVLMEYIANVPGLLGRERVTKPYGPRLSSEQGFAILLAKLPERNFEFVLVTIAFFAAYAELGRTHSLGYRGWIKRLAKMLHAVVIRPLELGDRSSLHTLRLVLKTPLRFRSIAMTERSKRVPNRDQMPSQPLFRKQIGIPTYYQSDADKLSYDESGSQSWSRCATEGGDTEPNSDASDIEQCLSGDVTNENYDSEEFDIAELKPIQSQAHVVRDKDHISTVDAVDHAVHKYSLRTETNSVQGHPGLSENRLIRKHNTLPEGIFTLERDVKTIQSQLMGQEPGIEPELPVTNGPFMPGLWALSLPGTVDAAGHDINSMTFKIYGRRIPFSGRVPIVVAKCVEKILCSESEAENSVPYCLRAGRYPSNPENFAQLKEAFNEPPSYGAKVDWSKYTAADATHVLFDYLKSLPEPLIPSDLSCKLPSLDNYVQRNYIPSDWSSLQVYAVCMTRLSEHSRQLLLILIGLLASQVDLAERNHCNDSDGFYNEAARCCYPVLSHPLENRLATFTLLIVNAGYLLGLADHGRRPTATEWNNFVEARKQLGRNREADDLLREETKLKEAQSDIETKQEHLDVTSLNTPREQLEEEEQGSLHERAQLCSEHSDYQSRRKDGGEALGYAHHEVVEDIVPDKPRSTSLGNGGTTSNEVVKSPERGWVWEPVDHEDTEAVDTVETHVDRPAAKVKETGEEHHHLGASTPRLTPPLQSRPQSLREDVQEPIPAFKPPNGKEAETPPVVSRNTFEQDMRGEGVAESMPFFASPTSREPTVGEQSTEHDLQQYFEGWSMPSSPKRDIPPPPTVIPELNITSADDTVVVERPSSEHQQEERITITESVPNPDRVGETEAEDAVFVRRHKSKRRSGCSHLSGASEARPRSSTGESVKSQRRHSNEEETQQHVKKQHRKSNSSFGKPQKGFRKWFHGITK